MLTQPEEHLERILNSHLSSSFWLVFSLSDFQNLRTKSFIPYHYQIQVSLEIVFSVTHSIPCSGAKMKFSLMRLETEGILPGIPDWPGSNSKLGKTTASTTPLLGLQTIGCLP
jgi:hypothetical protein